MRSYKYLLALFLAIVILAARGLTKRTSEPPVPLSEPPRAAEKQTSANPTAARLPNSESVVESDKPGDPPSAAAQQLAWSYYQGLNNAFFDRDAFLRELPQGGAPLIVPLRGVLMDPRPLMGLRPDVQVSQEKPPVVMQRMAMLDLLGSLARRPGGQDSAVARDARFALGAIVSGPWDRELPEHVKRVALAERYDALVRLALADGEFAIRITQGLTPETLRDRLHPALVDGLRASGVPSEEISKRFSKKTS